MTTNSTTTKTPVTITTKPTGITLSGDANCDGKLSVADATLVLQYCGNKDKYTISEQGLLNADVDGTAGISAVDALIIQQVDAGIYDISDLPLTK
ncbi:MAG: dockerin type I repeat-containing protein [Ruminococcus sp.]|nr:dockerin type I repeat-containing protein [Ruminococcus sp.]